MERLKQFISNAGFTGVAQTFVILVLIVSTLVQDVNSGTWVYTAPILASVFLAAFLLREVLVEHVQTARLIMNGLAVAGIATYLIIYGKPLPFWLDLLLTGFVGLYIGCYFLMLSDPRIAVGD